MSISHWVAILWEVQMCIIAVVVGVRNHLGFYCMPGTFLYLALSAAKGCFTDILILVIHRVERRRVATFVNFHNFAEKNAAASK